MAEFDSKAFSAVDAFFGNESKNEIGENETKTQPKSFEKKRLGLGAIQKIERKTNDITKQLLKQKRKKGHKNAINEYEEEEEFGQSETNLDINEHDDGDDDDEEEEEKGRTGAIQDRKKPLMDHDSIYASHESKKKKKGKKERQKEQQKKEEEQQKQKQQIHEQQQQESISEPNTNVNTECSTENVEIHKSKKRKRPKIRSRQKNIRKDNRSNEQKPKELIVSRDNKKKDDHYAGRPLTPETRKLLNLPTSKKSSQLPLHLKEHINSKNHTIGLAVDDWLNNDMDEKVNENNGNISKKSKKRKKQKISKYKNLM